MSNTGHDDVKAPQRDGSSPLVGVPKPDNSLMSELLLGIALQAAYQGSLSSRGDIAIEYQFDGAHYAR